jgi:hypothetical protein
MDGSAGGLPILTLSMSGRAQRGPAFLLVTAIGKQRWPDPLQVLVPKRVSKPLMWATGADLDLAEA